MKNNKGFAGINILVAIVALVIVAGGAYYFGTRNTSAPKIENPGFCGINGVLCKDKDDNISKENHDNDKGILVNYQKAKIVNLTGLDGCGYVIELENGERLEPINLTEEFKKDNLLVLIKYKEKSINSICMAGKGVELIDIKLNTSAN